jgi:hypothetical protein
MGEVWIPEAEDLNPAGSSGTMSGQGGPRCTLHCTVSNPGSFNAMHDVLTDKQAEPHLLYDYKSDRLGQYFPLNKSARALMSGSHSISHNKMGTVNIQIEVCAQPVDWTADDDWHPGPNFRAMVRAVRSWGIADRFVYRLASSGGDNVRRSWDTFDSSSTGGGLWWGHCHVPSPESHWDPGPLNLDRFFSAAGSEDDMAQPYFLVRRSDADYVYVADTMTRRWVQSQGELGTIKKAWQQIGWTDTTVYVVDYINGAGTLIGLDPYQQAASMDADPDDPDPRFEPDDRTHSAPDDSTDNDDDQPGRGRRIFGHD